MAARSSSTTDSSGGDGGGEGGAASSRRVRINYRRKETQLSPRHHEHLGRDAACECVWNDFGRERAGTWASRGGIRRADTGGAAMCRVGAYVLTIFGTSRLAGC